MKLAIIYVLYRSYDVLEKMLLDQDWKTISNLDIDIFVVDNTTGSEKRIDYADHCKLNYGVNVLDPQDNLGYFGAPRWALKKISNPEDYDYVVVSNVDLTYSIVDMFKSLQSKNANESKDVGMYAPCLVDDRGQMTRQLHYYSKPSRKKYEFLSKVYSNYGTALIHRLAADVKRRIRRESSPNLQPFLFAPHGALMIFTKRYVQIPGSFDHPAFLFCEEVFAGAKCEAAGLRCELAPDIAYQHDNHGSMGKIPSRAIVEYLRQAHLAAAQWL
ncbi:hypothetical protein [Devosia sp. Leaf64]|uniref:hypothetical protein n=1 Tax=Devosia sp. Leaf64 TaxID=1736229 RepID=UPI000712462E|nr:hypothetical protein [Devosia sp. Leaf64]KQN74787.1 hypothetical protein ASE94_00120 [Devosia sp. Leaf64]